MEDNERVQAESHLTTVQVPNEPRRCLRSAEIELRFKTATQTLAAPHRYGTHKLCNFVGASLMASLQGAAYASAVNSDIRLNACGDDNRPFLRAPIIRRRRPQPSRGGN